MAVTYIASTTNWRSGAGTLFIGEPTLVSGDLHLAWLTGTASLSSQPLGWTRVFGFELVGTNIRAELYWRWASTLPFDMGYGFSLGSGGAGVVAAYRGTDISGGPLHLWGWQSNAASTIRAAPSVSPTISDGYLTCWYAIGTAGNNTAPAGMTERADVDDNNEPPAGIAAYLVDQQLSASGPTGIKNASGVTSDVSIGASLVLAPVPPPGEDGYLASGMTGGAAASAGGLVGNVYESEIGTPPSGAGSGSGPYFRMRAFDQTLGRIVYWTTPTVDGAGASYTGPGPLVDIVVSYKKCD